jgi:carbon storage regulator
MLVLTREINEGFMIGDDVRVVVLDVRRGANGLKVRLGIEAPREVAVHRDEIHARMKGEREGGDDGR